jgi:beta-fructofuranosidase
MISMRCKWLALALFCLTSSLGFAQSPDGTIGDKTLVAWVSPSTLDQSGGSVLTLDNGDGTFDGIVFGEVQPKRWMPGSNNFSRTEKNQTHWPMESATPDHFVQVAVVYHGRDVSLYRNGQPYAHYTMTQDPQKFGLHSLILFGRRHLDAADKKSTFIGRIKDARVYDQALDLGTVAALKPGKLTSPLKPWAWWFFADEGLREKTGRFNQLKLIGDVRIEKGCLVLTGMGATLITACSSGSVDSAITWAPIPREWPTNASVPPEAVRSARALRERFLADPYRPRYHFCVPEDMGMPGDPNGAFFANGRYHLMYLYNRSGSGFCWGHISSQDLVHWRHHPDGIGPGNGDDGCFSGGAFLDDDGTAYLSYWMLWGAKGIGLARSTDRTLDRWTKFEANPVIRSTDWGVTEIKEADGKQLVYGSADPSNIWKKNGHYYMLTGNLLVLNKYGRTPDAPAELQGDRLYLFTSDDLKNWRYLHVFYDRKPEWTDRSEDNMCPSFHPLPSRPDGGPASDKQLLLFISHNKGCQYYVGDYRNDLFYPLNHGRMTWIDNTYFAPEALIDGKGRQIMWAWLTDNPSGEEQKGWSGVYGLPRTLWLGDDGTLRMRPVPELESLRGNELLFQDTTLESGQSRTLDRVEGDACELQCEILTAGTARCGLKVRASSDGKEETLLYYDVAKRELVFDASRCGKMGRPIVERAPLELKPLEPLRLQIFVDKSVVEIYANDRQAIARRVYPEGTQSLGVVLFSEGGKATFSKVRTWEMAPSNPY